MTNNYYQKHKERLWKETCKKYQNLSEAETNKRKKRPLKDIKISQKKKKKKSISIIVKVIKICDEEKKKLVEYIRNYYITNNK